MTDYKQLAADDPEAFNRIVELVVFGDDLSVGGRLDRLTLALVDFASWKSGPPNSPSDDFYRYCMVRKISFTDGWKRREGVPWQSDLEAHVANWRAKPRNFRTPEGCKLIKDEMVRREFMFRITRLPSDLFRAEIWGLQRGRKLSCEEAGTEELAVALAAIQACEKEKGGE